MKGTPEPDGFLHHTSFTLDVQQVLQKAHSYNASLTTFLCAALLQALYDL